MSENPIPSLEPAQCVKKPEPRRNYLYEVAAIRAFAIAAIFVVHSFAIFGEGWKVDRPLPDIPLFRFIPFFLSSFRLQALVFVTGYVYAFQSLALNRDGSDNPRLFLWKKGRRLLLPWLLFSIPYLVIFGPARNLNYVWTFLVGPGHLWFLPMLFWCYVGTMVIVVAKLRFRWWWVPLYGLAYLVSLFLPEVLNAPNAIRHALYFFMGYAVYARREECSQVFATAWFRLASVVLFLAWFSFTYFYGTALVERTLPDRLAGGLLLGNKAALSVVGILALYTNVVYWVSRSPRAQRSKVLNNVNRYNYGLYIYHQFVMMAVLRFVCLPYGINLAFVPFILFASGTLGATLLTLLTLKTKVGKELIG